MGGTRRARWPVRAAGALVLASAVAGLGGCGVLGEAGTAVVIEGATVPTTRLQDLTNELVDAGYALDPQTQQALPPGEAQRQVLGLLITSEVLARLARDEGVSVTQGEVDGRYAEFVEATGGEQALEEGLGTARAVPPSYARDYVRDILLAERVQQSLVPGDDADPAVQEQRAQALSDRLVQVGQELDVEVNPRYGTWTPTTGQVEALVSGGLSVPEDEGAATPTVPAQP